MSKFSADEIFEMAEQIERAGAAFYAKAAAQTDSETTRKTLEGLAEMEQQHEEIFAGMRAELAGAQAGRTTFDPDGEAALYLGSFVEGKVFDVDADPSARLTGSEKPEEILTTAIGLEKDSIVFYLGIKAMVPAKLGGEKVEDIIREEMSHVRMLSDELAALA